MECEHWTTGTSDILPSQAENSPNAAKSRSLVKNVDKPREPWNHPLISNREIKSQDNMPSLRRALDVRSATNRLASLMKI